VITASKFCENYTNEKLLERGFWKSTCTCWRVCIELLGEFRGIDAQEEGYFGAYEVLSEVVREQGTKPSQERNVCVQDLTCKAGLLVDL
jgi:hypothetical protein